MADVRDAMIAYLEEKSGALVDVLRFAIDMLEPQQVLQVQDALLIRLREAATKAPNPTRVEEDVAAAILKNALLEAAKKSRPTRS